MSNLKNRILITVHSILAVIRRTGSPKGYKLQDRKLTVIMDFKTHIIFCCFSVRVPFIGNFFKYATSSV